MIKNIIQLLIMTRLQALWNYRGFILASVKRELYARYLGSQFGLAWAVIHPFSLILLYTLVFSKLMRPTLNGHNTPFAYSIYLCAGLLTWTLFSELLGRTLGLFIQHANLLKKVKFPRLTLPVISIIGSLLHYGIIMVIFLFFLICLNSFPGLIIISALPVLLVLLMFTMGLGIFAGVLNVFYRDIEQLIALILQFWFWFTPIVYARPVLPDWLAGLLAINPLLPLITAMQKIFLESHAPAWITLIYPLLLSILLLLLSWNVYQKLKSEILDEL